MSDMEPTSTKKVIVVGLRGLAFAGKTTIAKELQGRSHFALRSMAGPLKDGLRIMGITKESTPDLYRKYAQEIGAALRARDPDHFVKLFLGSLPAPNRSGPPIFVVVDDIRYPNEAGVCDHLFFIQSDWQTKSLGKRASHESETWNRNREGRIDAFIDNPQNQPNIAADTICQHLDGLLS